MLVKDSGFTASDAIKLVAIVVSIIVIVGCAVLYFRLRKEWRRYDGRVAIPGKFEYQNYFFGLTGYRYVNDKNIYVCR